MAATETASPRSTTRPTTRPTTQPAAQLASLLDRLRACRICAERLPFAPRPVLQAAPGARLLIVGQAPGRRAHISRQPWNDASGERLRRWTGLGRAIFYDRTRVALVPMGLCYPGSAPGGGDLPPCSPCAPRWHGPIFALMPHVRLTLLVGGFAQRRYLGTAHVTGNVRAWRQHLEGGRLPLPHPSWRNTAWLARNPWFEAELVPQLRRLVAETVA